MSEDIEIVIEQTWNKSQCAIQQEGGSGNIEYILTRCQVRGSAFPEPLASQLISAEELNERANERNKPFEKQRIVCQGASYVVSSCFMTGPYLISEWVGRDSMASGA